MENKNILITGGCGFIGSNIAKELCLKNKVRILDNLSTGNINNIKNLNVEYMWGDITNLETCRVAVKGIDVICHQAALGSVPRSILDPLSTHNSNVNGFLNILISAKEQGIKRIVYASSSSVYGDNNTLPKVEENIGEQLSSYAVSKHINELYAKVFSKNYGWNVLD
jgi:UDP-N-acetylglucosamine 4-epimerase